MSLEVALQENTAAIHKLIVALANAPLPIGQTDPAVKTNKPAAAKESAPKAAQPEAPMQAQPAPETKPAAAEATVEDARKAVLALSKTKGRDAAVAVLTTFGADKVPALKPEQFAEFVAACHAEIQK